MRRLALLLLIGAMCGCAANKGRDYQFVESMQNSKHKPVVVIHKLTQEIATNLIEQSDLFAIDTPVVIATPVLSNDFTSTTSLSSQLQQGLIAGFKMHGYQVIDVNVAEALRVTSTGDFILSRDWKLLPQDQNVEHIVVSSIDMDTRGIIINSRIVNLTDNHVLSAVQSRTPAKMLAEYLALSEKVVVRDGNIYRYPQRGHENVQQVGVKQ
ncbi:hypothetical protein D5R81_00165 [Parashewanella spongiae]|uniref:FlgO domain-containing protein n=1 Tax=Parashewanella spongiae TaxID=342950 RepID=A0A3A6UC05_9GAMM|nr:FlgO family outer membrane protein [Parashewanella spongiae]MCL1076598.1 hypothetical protein [Parashewanella spongiae]RJY19554.1 hypothetical protein D5R81_00165 [Parashewanella spongiae]